MLVLLVAISLILLTDYFGESQNSPLHGVQRGIAEVLSPIQAGASTVLSPVRSAAHWVSSTLQAESQVGRLKRENEALNSELAQKKYKSIQYFRMLDLLKLDNALNVKQYDPVAATIIGRDPQLWYQTIELDEGSDAGVRPQDPVIGPGGLVGDVANVTAVSSNVTLLTSPKFAVGAMVLDGGNGNAGDTGVLKPAVGNPNELILSFLPSSNQLGTNREQVVTSGFQDPHDPIVESWAPPGIPIGTTPGGSGQQTGVVTSHQVSVVPTVDLSHLSVVQILTNSHPHS